MKRSFTNRLEVISELFDLKHVLVITLSRIEPSAIADAHDTTDRAKGASASSKHRLQRARAPRKIQILYAPLCKLFKF